jgi:hypothetical protein
MTKCAISMAPSKSQRRAGRFTSMGAPTLMLCEIETDQSFSLTDLLQEFERLELKALGQVKHGDVSQDGRTR